jgi:hypothetical protein
VRVGIGEHRPDGKGLARWHDRIVPLHSVQGRDRPSQFTTEEDMTEMSAAARAHFQNDASFIDLTDTADFSVPGGAQRMEILRFKLYDRLTVQNTMMTRECSEAEAKQQCTPYYFELSSDSGMILIALLKDDETYRFSTSLSIRAHPTVEIWDEASDSQDPEVMCRFDGSTVHASVAAGLEFPR